MNSLELLGREVRLRRPSNGSKTAPGSLKFRSAAMLAYGRSPNGPNRAILHSIRPAFARGCHHELELSSFQASGLFDCAERSHLCTAPTIHTLRPQVGLQT